MDVITRRYLPIIACLIALALFAQPTQLIQPSFAIEGFLPAKVKDISDRAYEPAVIELLDGAKESINISMYNISLGRNKRNPIMFLLYDLLEARERGVEVTIYLNTRFTVLKKSIERLIKNPFLKELKAAGCAIHFIPKSHRLHDKLIVVDGRYVVEGSTNWSISALKSNFESATLIDSPELAKIKLLRLKMLPLTYKSKERVPPTAAYLEKLPKYSEVPKALITDKNYFSRMVTKQDKRAMDLYLLLLAYSQGTEKKEFFVDLEAMGLSLGLPSSWSYTALRRQAIRSLKKLKDTYNLLDLKFFYGKDAWVELREVSGEVVTVPSQDILSSECSVPLKHMIMIKALLEFEGKDIYTTSKRSLAKRFYLNRATVRAALKELLKDKITKE